MIVSFVVAVADNGLIGRDNGLPWHIPADLKYFKSVTMGKPIVMGRKTFESIGRPLPGRTNIVITRNGDYAADGIKVVTTIDAAIDLAATETDEVMIIGGAQIYKSAFPKCNRLYLTEVHLSPEGDAFFPDYDKSEWVETKREDFAKTDEAPAYSFIVLNKTS